MSANSDIEFGQVGVFDDVFPYRVSGFRFTEYMYLLRRFPHLCVYSSMASLGWLGVSDQKESILQEFHRDFPEENKRLRVIEDPKELANLDGIYTLFVNNAVSILDVCEQNEIPFSFTLYPGGGLALGNHGSDQKLRRVFSSPMFKEVIVTMPIVLEYLQRNLLVAQDRVSYNYGGILNSIGPDSSTKIGKRNSLNVCFVAYRYDPHGIDKGLDIFLKVAKRLEEMDIYVEFHLFGPWTNEDLAYHGTVIRKAVFHGLINNDVLQEELSEMDIVVSPTRAGILGDGSFDGYPTGASVEAGLAGCAIVNTNPYGMQTPMIDGEHLVECKADVASTLEAVIRLIRNPDGLLSLRQKGREKLREVFDLDHQMLNRVQVVDRLAP